MSSSIQPRFLDTSGDVAHDRFTSGSNMVAVVLVAVVRSGLEPGPSDDYPHAWIARVGNALIPFTTREPIVLNNGEARVVLCTTIRSLPTDEVELEENVIAVSRDSRYVGLIDTVEGENLMKSELRISRSVNAVQRLS